MAITLEMHVFFLFHYKDEIGGFLAKSLVPLAFKTDGLAILEASQDIYSSSLEEYLVSFTNCCED